MNVVDKIQLELLLAELVQARPTERNELAQASIRRALEHQPDAGYLLVQRVLQLESALCGLRSRTADADHPVAREHPATVARSRREAEPWWQPPIQGLAATPVLAQSISYLFADRARVEEGGAYRSA